MRIQELVFKSELIWDFESILLYLKASFWREHCHKSTLSSVLALSVTPLEGAGLVPHTSSKDTTCPKHQGAQTCPGMGAAASPAMALRDNNSAQSLLRVYHLKGSWGKAQFRQNVPKSPKDPFTGKGRTAHPPEPWSTWRCQVLN